MKHRLTCVLAIAGATAALSLGCAVRGEGRGAVDTPVVFTQQPTLVVVEPGVSVVRDADYPVYWVDDSYWVYRDDVWYRSNTYEGGWAVVDVNIVPMTIAHRDHRAYVHYRGPENAETRPAPRMPVASHEREPHERAVEQRGGPHGGEAPAATAHDRPADVPVAKDVRKDDKRPPAEQKHEEAKKPDVVDKKPETARKPDSERRSDPARKPDDVRKPDAEKKNAPDKKSDKK